MYIRQGEKLSTEVKTPIEVALKDLEAVLKEEDKAKIDEKMQNLIQVSSQLIEAVQHKDNTVEGSSNKVDSDVVDAEFEEVKDKK